MIRPPLHHGPAKALTITALFLLLFLLLPPEALVSRIYIETATMEDTIGRSLAIVTAKRTGSREFTFDASFDVPFPGRGAATYSVTATEYLVQEILWKDEEAARRHSVEVRSQITALKVNDTIFAIDPNMAEDAHEDARYRSGAGSKSYKQSRYRSKYPAETSGREPVILFLMPMSRADNTWRMTNGAVESLKARKEIEDAIRDRRP